MATSKTAIFWSFTAGVVVSLIITAGVFIWVNNAPIPFVSKVQQVSSNVDEQLLDGKSIDPNRKLYDAGQGEEQRQGVVTVTANGNAPAEDSTEVINTERFWVQAGTFATNEEAEAMRASIAFIGLDAQISSIRQAGKRVYLVRIGPFDTADNAEEIRQSLADNAIQGTVIHQPN
ncbi:MAG: SPOR domain-containing protein [Duodenibacillus sp.]|nr:SPOR domain-containing protein [Duodenibacillus sp.]